MNTVWQVVDLESEKVFFTTRESQAERWNNDEQFEVTTSPSRRPVAGYTTWMLDSNTDKYSLKLGMETFVPPHLTQAEKEELQTEERWGPPACECLECCAGEHVGSCRECAGWGESDCKPCECCGGTGVCPKCHGAEKELTGEVISLCKCGVWLRTDISICPRCEKPYFADGRTIAGRHA